MSLTDSRGEESMKELQHGEQKGTHTFVKRCLDFLHRVAESGYSVQAFRLQSLKNKQEMNNLSGIVTAVKTNVEKFTCMHRPG